MSGIYYFIAGPEEWGIKPKRKKRCGNHHWKLKAGKKVLVWPEEINSHVVSPQEIEHVKQETGTTTWLIADRISQGKSTYCIMNHVNRSGMSFLRGKTPHGNRAMFPDVSFIYNSLPETEEIVVDTVGPKRFDALKPENDTIWSEGIGLVAPVVFYSGVKIIGIGTADPGIKGKEILSYNF